MKKAFLVGMLVFLAGASAGQVAKNEFGLPKLHSIRNESLSPSYSCRSKEEIGQGYQRTALFLSDYSKRRNSPDLVFNGACGSEDYFDGSTAGDDMSLISDLGSGVSVDDVSASKAFNLEGGEKSYSKFAQTAKVLPGHTYAVLINKAELRGLLIFTVVEYKKNSEVDIRYAVKSYQVLRRVEESSGFDWERRNSN